MKNAGTILVLVLLGGLITFIVIEAVRSLPPSSDPTSIMISTPTDEITKTIATYDPPPTAPIETPTLLPTPSVSLTTNTVTPTNTSTQTLFPSPSATATNTPSPTPYIGKTPTPTLVHGLTAAFAPVCNNTESEIQYNCWYVVQYGDTFQRIALKFYRAGSGPSINHTFVQTLYNTNRTPYGTYYESLSVGMKVFIPQVHDIEPQSRYIVPYRFCERDRPTIRPTLPCYFEVIASDTWETISREICLNDTYSENIKNANRKFVNAVLTNQPVDLTDKLVIVIPRPRGREC